jgi:adenylate cyclase
MAISPLVIASTGVVTGLTRYGYEIRWRNRMTDLFGRYVPRAVVTDLISKRALQDVAVGGKRRDVTVMFADIRGFTKFTESNQPETVLDRLNEFLEVMVDCTFEQEGTVDKFIGDAILVLFNAPTDQPDHAERAVKTAWAIQQKLNETIDDYENSELRIGIGIHTGNAIVGTVGTPERMEYTAIGSTVNTASRLCDRADGGKVVVSQEVVKAAGAEFAWSENQPMTVKGIDRPLQTATLIGREAPTD